MAFEDWFDEIEGFGLRSERALNDLGASKATAIAWLRAAYEHGQSEAKPVIQGLLDHAVYDREKSDECIAAVEAAESFLSLAQP